tara:strand:+ start:253 stop:549 length:297 start_codon:yes stop_codon:yes gene_type:complete
MRITFKELDDGLTNEVFVGGTYIGTIVKDIWNGKWEMKPDFNYYGHKLLVEKMKYDSFYKAGKAMAKLYNEVHTFFDYDDQHDTQEIDMRGIFKKRGP